MAMAQVVAQLTEDMMSDFDAVFAATIGLEGGYVNDPQDPGGETKYGISKRQYPSEDIPTMTLERAKILYKRDYWDAVKGDMLPAKLNHIVFDTAVNQGVDAAIKLLQRVLGVTQDGILGKDTMRMLEQKMSKTLCCNYLSERAMRYIGTRNFDRFGRGWFYRLFSLAMEL